MGKKGRKKGIKKQRMKGRTIQDREKEMTEQCQDLIFMFCYFFLPSFFLSCSLPKCVVVPGWAWLRRERRQTKPNKNTPFFNASVEKLKTHNANQTHKFFVPAILLHTPEAHLPSGMDQLHVCSI